MISKHVLLIIHWFPVIFDDFIGGGTELPMIPPFYEAVLHIAKLQDWLINRKIGLHQDLSRRWTSSPANLDSDSYSYLDSKHWISGRIQNTKLSKIRWIWTPELPQSTKSNEKRLSQSTKSSKIHRYVTPWTASEYGTIGKTKEFQRSWTPRPRNHWKYKGMSTILGQSSENTNEFE